MSVDAGWNSLFSRAKIITDADGRMTHAILPYEDFDALREHHFAAEHERIVNDPGTEWLTIDEAKAVIAGIRIAQVRKDRGMTQAQLGKLVGMPQSQISRLEKNPDASSLRQIRKIAKALGVSAKELL